MHGGFHRQSTESRRSVHGQVLPVRFLPWLQGESGATLVRHSAEESLRQPSGAAKVMDGDDVKTETQLQVSKYLDLSALLMSAADLARPFESLRHPHQRGGCLAEWSPWHAQ